MIESNNQKECDHLTDNFALGNNGIYYCTMCDKTHDWKDGEILTDKQKSQKDLFEMVYDWGRAGIDTDWECNAFQKAVKELKKYD